MKFVLLFNVFCVYTQALLPKNTLKQIVLSRALTTTITETIALNVFDVSALVHEIACDCENHTFLPIYAAGFVTFGYLYFVNGANDRLKKVYFYSNMRQNMRFILLTMFLVLGKNVENAI
jgi:hypothetical protein